MNKKRVDGWILKAKRALCTFGIAENGKIVKTYRSHISSFGSAVAGGSLVSAAAFFCEQGNAKVAQENLLQAMYYLITDESKSPRQILEAVCREQSDSQKYHELKEKFEDASLALKRAMNFFDLIDDEQDPARERNGNGE